MYTDQLLTDLFQAYYDARKNKRNTKSALVFEMDCETHLFALYDDIRYRRYVPSESTCFVVHNPVQREIFAADFRDRVVHHLVFNYLSPIFERYFIADSYSCRKGKGTSYGIRRVEHFIRSCTRNYSRDAYILKLDIRGYFMNIDKRTLYRFIVERLHLEQKKYQLPFDVDLVQYLVHSIVFHDPTQCFRITGERRDWLGLPKSKSLFFAQKEKGLPIGNLTSQLFGNIYMNEFDHTVRDSFGCNAYGRYVDDMVFIHTDKAFLKALISKIDRCLYTTLALTLHPKKIYLQHISKGVAFLGTYIKPYCTYIGNRTKQHAYDMITYWNSMIHHRPRIEKHEIDTFISSINAYLGMMKHHDTFHLRKHFLTHVLSPHFLRYVSYAPDYGKVVMKKSIYFEQNMYIMYTDT